MSDDWDDESEEMPEREHLQFSLRTLMTIVTGVAIFFSLLAWWGLYPVVFILSSALGTFLGLLICCYLGMGFAFDDLRWDIPKCLMVACVTMATIYILPALQIPILLYIYPFAPPFFYWLCMSVCWNDLELPEIFICAVISFITWALMVFVTYKLFGA